MILIPYIKVKDEWTIPEWLMKGIWLLLVQQELHRIVFYSGTAKNEDEFIAVCQASGTHVVICTLDDGQPAALGFLNNWNGHGCAHAHWVCFKGIWGTPHTDEAIQKCLGYWFAFEKDGAPVFETLMGVYPETNLHIDRFARRAGFTVVGTVPGMFYNFWEGKRVGAIITYIERGTVCHS